MIACVVHTDNPNWVAVLTHIEEPMDAHNIPNIKTFDWLTLSLGSMILPWVVSVTLFPRKMAHTNSMIPASTTTCFNLVDLADTAFANCRA